jgi:subtilisin family serine protease
MLLAKSLRLPACLAALALLPAAVPTAARAQAQVQLEKLNPVLRVALAQEGAQTPNPLRSMAASQTEPGYEVFIRGPVSVGELTALGVEVRTDLGDIKTAFVPEAALAAASSLPDVQRIEGAVPVDLENDLSIPATGADALRGGPPNFLGVNGAGVVIGDVDTGVDWAHADFDDPAGNTRLVYIWDQTDAVGPAPGAFGYGSEWTSADIDLGIAREHDTDGHGSHVLGTAGGDGSHTGNGQPAFQYTGMAPMASLIMVKTTFFTSTIVDGVNYIFQKAGATPAVANLSLGTHYGPHDGTSTFEQALAALTGHGKLLIKSAGNENNRNLHAQVNAGAAPGTPARLANTAPPGPGRMAVDGYYHQADNISMTLTLPNGVTLGPVAQGGALFTTVAGVGTIYMENGVTPTNSGDHEVYVQIDNSGGVLPATGNYTMRFIAVATPAGGEVDLWRFAHTIGGGNSSFSLGQQNDELVSEPGNSDSLCTCAAWTTKRPWLSIDGNNYFFTGATMPGTLAPFSSPGPTRDGRIKPDIAAPGTAIVSVRSFDSIVFNNPANIPLIVPDGVHAVIQGTSMAAPHVAGAGALVQQARGKLWPSQFCQLLKLTALVDVNTGVVPNTSWGYGKLLLQNLTAAALSRMDVDVAGGTVQLTWSLIGGVTISDFRVERRIGQAGPFAPIATPVEVFDEQGVTTYRVVDLEVLPGLTYQYQIHGRNTLDETVTFGPFEATVPAAAALSWALAAPAPNPAPRGRVQFVYSAAARGPASLTIYDARGREVAQPLSGTVEPGTHTLGWSGTDQSGARLASGIYLVVFRGGGKEFRQKVVLLD